MTPADVRKIREDLGRALGRRISQRDLGLALGLTYNSAHDTVRSWEDGSRDVSGPASVALEFMSHASAASPTPPAVSAFILGLVEDLFARAKVSP